MNSTSSLIYIYIYLIQFNSLNFICSNFKVVNTILQKYGLMHRNAQVVTLANGNTLTLIFVIGVRRVVNLFLSQPPIHYQKDCKYVNSSMMFLVTSLLVIFTLQSQTISVNFRGIFITTPNPNTEKLSAEFIWWNFSTRCHCNLMI